MGRILDIVMFLERNTTMGFLGDLVYLSRVHSSPLVAAAVEHLVPLCNVAGELETIQFLSIFKYHLYDVAILVANMAHLGRLFRWNNRIACVISTSVCNCALPGLT